MEITGSDGVPLINAVRKVFRRKNTGERQADPLGFLIAQSFFHAAVPAGKAGIRVDQTNSIKHHTLDPEAELHFTSSQCFFLAFQMSQGRFQMLAKIADDQAFDEKEAGAKDIGKPRHSKAIVRFKEEVSPTCEAKDRG